MTASFLFFVNINATAEVEKMLPSIIVFFCSISLLLFVAILVYRSIKIADNDYTVLLKQTYAEVFAMAAFSTSDELQRIVHQTLRLNQKFLDKRKHAQQIADELLQLHHNFSGESRQNLARLYAASGFEAHTARKIKSRYWEVVARGMNEAAQMKCGNVNSLLQKISQGKNRLLRENARLALIKINGFDGLHFLDELTEPLSDWEQINLIEALKEYRTEQLPDFGRWLSCPEKTITLFATRLIGYFKQNEAAPILVNLLHDNDRKLRCEAVRALAELQYTEALPLLMQLFPKEEQQVQLAILEAFSLMGASVKETVMAELPQLENEDLAKACIKTLYEVSGGELPVNAIPIRESLRLYADYLLKQSQNPWKQQYSL